MVKLLSFAFIKVMEYIKHSHALVLFASSLGKFGLARKGDK